MLFWLNLYVGLFVPVVVANLAAALRWGGRSEVWVASGYFAATVLQKTLQGVGGPMYARFEPFVAIIDVALALGLILLAVHSPKIWILCAAALQLIVSFAHIARLLDPQMSRLAYEILMGSGGYPSQILLSIGICRHAMRRSSAARRR